MPRLPQEAQGPNQPSGNSLLLLTVVNISAFALFISRGYFNIVALIAYSIAAVLMISLQVLWTRSSPIPQRFWNRALYFSVLITALLNVFGARMQYVSNPAFYLGARALSIPVLFLWVSQYPPLLPRISANIRRLLLILIAMLIVSMYLLVPMVSPNPWIDVMVYYEESARALLAGQNPYDIVYTNIYYPSTFFYPSGEANYYPYPPLTFVIGLSGLLLGDARWPLIAAHLLAGFLLFLTGRNRNLSQGESFSIAMLLLYLPTGLFIIENGWTEPTVILALAGCSYLLSKEQHKRFAWLASVVLALKQTMIVFLVLLLGLWRKTAPKWLIAVLTIPVLTYGLFLAWNPRAIANDLIYFHLATPFRPDGLTLGAWIYRSSGVHAPFWVALVPLILLLSLGIFRLRFRGLHPQIFSADRIAILWCSFAAVYLLTLLFSKHAFANYYYFFHFLLVLSLLWSRLSDQRPVSNGSV